MEINLTVVNSSDAKSILEILVNKIMNGNFIDTQRFKRKKVPPHFLTNKDVINTSFGKIRVLDSGGNKPVIINTPDGPNVIEHHHDLIKQLSLNFRVICFEFPGIGFSYPNAKYNYSTDNGARLIIEVMDYYAVKNAILALSCSNRLYAIKAAEKYPNRVKHLFLSQTCSKISLKKWSKKSIPNFLLFPVIGQISNAILESKLAKTWYKYALPKKTNNEPYLKTARVSLENGGCFCLSSLVQALNKEVISELNVIHTPSTLIWGNKDFTHKATKANSILEHLPNCEIVAFNDCGHFPELENTKRYVQLINLLVSV